MKVIIADDESLERKALRRIIEDHFPYMTIAGEASNGRLAIEMARKYKPDFMLMDIKMPGLNGIEAIQVIKKQNPAMQFIMVTAYESFQYAKEAMKEGIREYLLKPSTAEETVHAIQRVCQSISEEQDKQSRYSATAEIVLENILLKILQYEQTDSVLEQLAVLFPNMQNSFISVIECEKSIPSEQVISVLNKRSPFPFISLPYGNQLVLLFMSHKSNPINDSLQLAKRLQSEIFEKLWMGVGKSYTDLKEIRHSYEEAAKTVYFLKKQNGGRFAHYSEVDPTRDPGPDEIVGAIFSNNPSGAKSMLGKKLSSFQLMDLYILLRERMVQEEIDVSDLSYPENRNAWGELIRNVCRKINEDKETYDPVKLAKKYIDDHYHEAISLEQVAEMSGLSPTYFTKLFKEETDMTFIEFLTEVRLRKAMKLLNQKQYSLKQICYMVGYKDPNYFSRVFKKQHLLSPKQYIRQKAEQAKS
ncbi:response regulator [Fictibacillus sp. KIGAM418]|uniref:Response regulator n=1 Tax=Fictibacillus marinisediminis TaxID=2878389 RepID=A0A9X1XD77_9BACL|nr:response regulator [Fictibacillus marinisediminis]MCK6257258.1 response regulator [Fictibacillus marinisediminis]